MLKFTSTLQRCQTLAVTAFLPKQHRSHNSSYSTPGQHRGLQRRAAWRLCKWCTAARGGVSCTAKSRQRSHPPASNLSARELGSVTASSFTLTDTRSHTAFCLIKDCGVRGRNEKRVEDAACTQGQVPRRTAQCRDETRALTPLPRIIRRQLLKRLQLAVAFIETPLRQPTRWCWARDKVTVLVPVARLSTIGNSGLHWR